MGVDRNVYKGYGIMILTKKLTKEQKDLIFNNEEDSYEPYHFDMYKGDSSTWVFIPIDATKQKKIENAIYDFHTFIDPESSIESFILPLFELEKNKNKKQTKALKCFESVCFDGSYSKEEGKKIYTNTMKVLENKDAWYAGKFFVNYYS
jgi:hypothetical protein